MCVPLIFGSCEKEEDGPSSNNPTGGPYNPFTTDFTCTCTIDPIDGFEEPAVVTVCIGCNSEEADAFEAVCMMYDVMEGVTCVLD